MRRDWSVDPPQTPTHFVHSSGDRVPGPGVGPGVLGKIRRGPNLGKEGLWTGRNRDSVSEGNKLDSVHTPKPERTRH